jgi:spore coat protein U-like protein
VPSRSARRSLLAVLAVVLSATTIDGGLRAAAMQTCTVSTTPLAFGRYDPSQPVDHIYSGSISFNCALSQPISILLDHGRGGTGAMRAMRHGTYLLLYQIYFDPTATRVWGDGTGGSQFYSNTAPPVRTTVVVPFYGRIPAGQKGLVVGQYSDSVVVKIVF